MARSLRLAALLAALALLLPLAAEVEASCADCLWEASRDCCPPSCCPCCVHAPAVTGFERGQALLSEAGSTGHPPEASTLASDPRAVFHVPKRALA